MSVVELSLDGIAGHDRVVDEQAEGDDERGDRHLLDVEAQQVHHREGHGERERNGEPHDQRRPPLPEADERDENHQRNGLVEAAHEELHVLSHLQWLVGGPRQHQVRGEQRGHPGEGGIHGGAEVADLPARAHLHGQGDASRPPPGAVGLARAVVVQISGWLVATNEVHGVAQVDGSSRG